MADPVIVKEWMSKAEEDFRFAESNLEEGSEFFAQICFHFQQAAEKYLKACIIANDLPFEKVHDLVHLLRICSGRDPLLAELKEECILLNSAYIETRYPVHWPTDYTRETAGQAHDAAAKIAQAVKDRLGHGRYT
jgi:HEPN domain-containing protein